MSRLRTETHIVLVSVHSVRGSVPREVGAWMAVFSNGVLGTIGGGRLEWDAIRHAQAILLQTAQEPRADCTGVQHVMYRLGPSLGQCCGGEVQLQFEHVHAADAVALRTRLTPVQPGVALFGGGHVGHALVRVLSTLAMPIHWIDSRDEVFPKDVADTVQCEHSDPVQAAVSELASGSRVLIMSFSHAEDLEIVMACLTRQRLHGDLPYVGLIGSKSKWATFRSRLKARGFTDPEMDHVTCPIGVPGIADKRPEAIAISVAAQLLLLQKQA